MYKGVTSSPGSNKYLGVGKAGYEASPEVCLGIPVVAWLAHGCTSIPTDPPAAPASTPEPSEPEEEEEGLHHSPSVGSRRVATPAAITAVFAENEGLQYALRGTVRNKT